MSDSALVQQRIGRQIDRARILADSAHDRCAAVERGPAKRKLHRLGRRLGRVVRLLHLPHAHQPTPVVQALTGTTTRLMTDTRTLAHGLTCP
jgi:hypothetical protein